MSQRGVTLIEVMIAVAILGIISASAGFATAHMRQEARSELQAEQAQLLIDYRAGHLARGTTTNADTLARLEAPLPDVATSLDSLGSTTTVTLTWRDPKGRSATRAVTVFRKGAAP